MKILYEETLRLLTQGKQVVLATVIQQSGSAPRKSGAQMAIRDDGSFVGTVGGGRLEAETLTAARLVAIEDKAAVLEFHLTGREVAETEMICGGDVEVYLEPLSPGLSALYGALLEIERQGGKAALATVIGTGSAEKGTRGKLLIFPDDVTVGPLKLDPVALAAAQETIKERKIRLIPYQGQRLYLEPIFSEPTLYIFGAGHISRHVVPVAHMVGFKVIVIDDRAEFASREHFPQADEIWVEEFETVGEKIEPDEQSYMVIVTRGHMHDYTVLKQVLPMGSRYIGMIGSRRKRDIIFKQLLQEHHAQKDLNRVCAPIGLDIDAETPEEIAVSIVAELIKVRAEEKPAQEKKRKV